MDSASRSPTAMAICAMSANRSWAGDGIGSRPLAEQDPPRIDVRCRAAALRYAEQARLSGIRSTFSIQKIDGCRSGSQIYLQGVSAERIVQQVMSLLGGTSSLMGGTVWLVAVCASRLTSWRRRRCGTGAGSIARRPSVICRPGSTSSHWPSMGQARRPNVISLHAVEVIVPARPTGRRFRNRPGLDRDTGLGHRCSGLGDGSFHRPKTIRARGP